MENYTEYLDDFEAYRRKVKEQVIIFDKNIEEIFSKGGLVHEK